MDQQPRAALDILAVALVEVDQVGVVGEGAEVEEERPVRD